MHEDHDGEQSLAEAEGPDQLSVMCMRIFAASELLLELPPIKAESIRGWAAVIETILTLQGEFTLFHAGQKCLTTYLEVAREPADSELADPAFAPCWQAVVLYLHGAMRADAGDKSLVMERVNEFLQQQPVGVRV